MATKERFLQTLREALGRSQGAPPDDLPQASALSSSAAEVKRRAEEALQKAKAQAGPLMDRLEEEARRSGWKVARVASSEAACGYVADLAREKGARLVACSADATLRALPLEETLTSAGVAVEVVALDSGEAGPDKESKRSAFRRRLMEADIGVTGVDYAVAETGTCVILPRKGVSRLVSLLPPVHVAVVQAGQVLETVEEVLALRRLEFIQKGDMGSYMSLITGPSSTADIEQTLVVGVHGPKEVHMVLVE